MVLVFLPSEGDGGGEEMERSCITYSAHGGLQVAIRILADNVSNATVVLTSKLTGEQPCPSEGTHQITTQRAVAAREGRVGGVPCVDRR